MALKRDEVGGLKKILHMLLWAMGALLLKVSEKVFEAVDRWCHQKREEFDSKVENRRRREVVAKEEQERRSIKEDY